MYMSDIEDTSGNHSNHLAETPGLSLDEEFTRTNRYTNDCGFSKEVIARREQEMKELVKMYPNIVPAWIEMAWNFHEMTPKEEHDKIIAGNLWDSPPEIKRQLGGVLKNAISVEHRTEEEASA